MGWPERDRSPVMLGVKCAQTASVLPEYVLFPLVSNVSTFMGDRDGELKREGLVSQLYTSMKLDTNGMSIPTSFACFCKSTQKLTGGSVGM